MGHISTNRKMKQLDKTRILSIVKTVAAYLYLYIAFMAIVYYRTYIIWIAVKPISFILEIFTSLGYVILYGIVNHLLMKKIVGLKVVVIFETILFILIFVLAHCNAYYENHRPWSKHSADVPELRIDESIFSGSVVISTNRQESGMAKIQEITAVKSDT